MKEEPSNLKAGLPRRDQKEAAMDAAFIEDEVCTFMFTILVWTTVILGVTSVCSFSNITSLLDKNVHLSLHFI